MARGKKRNMACELIQRGEVANLRLIGVALAQSMRRQNGKDIQK